MPPKIELTSSTGRMVRVFALEVRSQRKVWPERQEREVRWLSAGMAAKTVREPMLSAIIRRLARGRVT